MTPGKQLQYCIMDNTYSTDSLEWYCRTAYAAIIIVNLEAYTPDNNYKNIMDKTR